MYVQQYWDLLDCLSLSLYLCYRTSWGPALLFVCFSQAAIWQRLLTCALFPLRRCLDTVRREFARLCCGLMDDYLDPDLLEHLEGISEEVR